MDSTVAKDLTAATTGRIGGTSGAPDIEPAPNQLDPSVDPTKIRQLSASLSRLKIDGSALKSEVSANGASSGSNDLAPITTSAGPVSESSNDTNDSFTVEDVQRLVERLAPGMPEQRRIALANALTSVLHRAGITTRRDAAVFVTRLAIQTAGFRFAEADYAQDTAQRYQAIKEAEDRTLADNYKRQLEKDLEREARRLEETLRKRMIQEEQIQEAVKKRKEAAAVELRSQRVARESLLRIWSEADK